MEIVKSMLFFIIAGLCEIGGGYLIWLWLREGGSFYIAILGENKRTGRSRKN